MIRLALFALLAFSLPAAAQYPERPVTLLAGYPPGGLVDVVARLVAEGMKAKFPKGIAVVNRPGAAGSVAVAELARSQPDGYTVVLTPHSALVIAAQINDLAYKTPDDYDPFINLVAYYPMIAVRSESPYQSIQELIADARANPGKIRVGSPGEGTSSHLNLEELMHRAGVKMIHVPYAGWGQSSPSLLGPHRGAGGAARRAQRAGRRQAHASSSRVPAAAPPGVPRRADSQGAGLGRGQRRVVPPDGAEEDAAAGGEVPARRGESRHRRPAVRGHDGGARHRRRLPPGRSAARRPVARVPRAHRHPAPHRHA